MKSRLALSLILLAAMPSLNRAADAPATTAPATSTAPAGNVVFVDQLDLTKSKQEYGDPVPNKSAENNPVTLKGKTFTHAFGTHANGVLVIDLKGAGKTFTASVGVDDDAEAEGSVSFHVVVDGKQVASTPIMHVGEAAKEISVDLTGAKQLVLKVDDGGDGINNDHGDWAMAKIELAADAKEKPVTVDADKELPPAK